VLQLLVIIEEIATEAAEKEMGSFIFPEF